MNEQVFLEFTLNFNLRQTRLNKPTIIYALFSFRGKQYKVNIGVKVYPSQWNKRKQIATISNGQTRLDNRNNEIVNKRIRSILASFEENKNYLCEDMERINFLFEEMKQIINPNLKQRNAMGEKEKLSATFILRQMVEKYIDGENSKNIYIGYVRSFENFLKTRNILNNVSSINGDTMEDYQQYLLSLNSKIATILNKLNGIKTLINHANKDKEIKAGIDITSFTPIKDRRTKEQKKSKQIPLTEEQLLAIYGCSNLKPKEEEARDLFISQCLLGQRISDLPKIFKGEYTVTKLEGNVEVISFVVQKTGEQATVYLFPLVKEILNKYKEKGFEHINLLGEDANVVRNNEAKLNRVIKNVCKKVGLDSDVIYTEQIGEEVINKKKKLYELIHTHIARHTFITLMCRSGIPKEDVIIATAHTDTTMIDDVYLHETVNDKGTRLINSLKKIKNSRLFKVEGTDNMVDATMNKQETVKKPISTASVADNITFETLLNTQFLASRINTASDMVERMGYVKDGKLYDYNDEINGIVKEVEAFMQSPASGFEVACKYVERLSVGNLSNLRDELKLLIVKCMEIEVNVETVMQIVDKAFRMGILDNDSLNDMKEIVSAILKAKEKEIEK